MLGGLAAALVALWVGENMGLGTYNHLLASSAVGVFFNSSPALGAKSGLAFWPLLTSLAILLAETGAAGRVSHWPVSSALATPTGLAGTLRRLGE